MMKSILAAGALALISGGASAAPIVVNGSFEADPGIPGYNGGSYGAMNWDIWASLPGWKSDGPAAGKGIEVQTGATLGLTPADGSYYVELDGNTNSSMWQDLTLGAGRYVLSFMYSPRVNSLTTNGIGFAILNSDWSLVKNGAINGPSLLTETAVGAWTKVTMDFSVAAGDYKLRFAANTDSDSLGGLIDDVAISAVPVPAAGLLLVGALGGLGLLRRRKAA